MRRRHPRFGDNRDAPHGSAHARCPRWRLCGGRRSGGWRRRLRWRAYHRQRHGGGDDGGGTRARLRRLPHDQADGHWTWALDRPSTYRRPWGHAASGFRARSWDDGGDRLCGFDSMGFLSDCAKLQPPCPPFSFATITPHWPSSTRTTCGGSAGMTCSWRQRVRRRSTC